MWLVLILDFYYEPTHTYIEWVYDRDTVYQAIKSYSLRERMEVIEMWMWDSVIV